MDSTLHFMSKHNDSICLQLSIKVGVTTMFCTCIKFEGHLIEHCWLGVRFVSVLCPVLLAQHPAACCLAFT
jgi:hypothetical protein